jgi:hypothetical protein
MGLHQEAIRADVPRIAAENRREFSRVNLRQVVTFHQQDGRQWTGHILDISANGIHASGNCPPPTGAEGAICISLGDATSLECIHALGRMGRVTATDGVLQFNELLGTESLEHLRQLILANADDPEAVESEFATHIGLRKRDTSFTAVEGGRT